MTMVIVLVMHIALAMMVVVMTTIMVLVVLSFIYELVDQTFFRSSIDVRLIENVNCPAGFKTILCLEDFHIY